MKVNEPRLLDSFLEYVRIDSETGIERDMALRLERELRALGCSVSFDNEGEKLGCNVGNLYAVLPGESGREPLLLSAHMDTVKPGLGIVPIVEDGVIHTDGSTVLGGDDKSGVAAIMEALRVLQEEKLPHPTLEIVFSIHEEGGVRGSANLDYSRLTAKRAVVLDSSGAPGKIILAAPGQYKLNVEILGKSSHAGVSPEAGISAIQVAADAIGKMKLLRIDEETTANIGSIHAQFATNVVPDRLTLSAEARSRNNDKLEAQGQHMLACIQNSCAAFGASFTGGLTLAYPGYQIPEDHPFVAQVKAACAQAGLEPVLGASGGGSDANHMNRHGITAIPLATGMSKVHSVEEFLTVEHLAQTARLVLALATA